MFRSTRPGVVENLNAGPFPETPPTACRAGSRCYDGSMVLRRNLFRLPLAWALLGVVASAVLPAAEEASVPARPTRVVVIPVREQVDSPLLFIIRRGLKQAIEEKADLVVLDMKTPGGALDVTFEIMEAIAKFQGRTLTFVNNEALSAGAFISATDRKSTRLNSSHEWISRMPSSA